MVVGVLVELSNKNIDKEFDYNVPEHLIKDIKIGIRVEVPFGRQTLDGFVLDIKDSSDMELKDIISIKDTDIVLNKELLDLGLYMSHEYLSTLISCYQVMLPKSLKANINGKNNIKYDTFYRLNNIDISNIKLNDNQLKIIELLKEKELVIRSELAEISISSINTLLKKNIIL